MVDQELWTLDQLTERVGDALAVGYPGPPSGRVREVPNQRAIRWYVTRGLVDPPLAMRGRQALYGQRHLLQLVAVKRLQAQGLPLARIQAELSGLPDHALTEIARVGPPSGADGNGADGNGADGNGRVPAAPPGAEVPAGGDVQDAGRIRFWAAAPELAPRQAAPELAPRQAAPELAPRRADTVSAAPLLTHATTSAGAHDTGPRAVRLAPGVLLILDAEAAGPLPDLTDNTLRAAARPLLDLLTEPGKTDEGTLP